MGLSRFGRVSFCLPANPPSGERSVVRVTIFGIRTTRRSIWIYLRQTLDAGQPETKQRSAFLSLAVTRAEGIKNGANKRDTPR